MVGRRHPPPRLLVGITLALLVLPAGALSGISAAAPTAPGGAHPVPLGGRPIHAAGTSCPARTSFLPRPCEVPPAHPRPLVNGSSQWANASTSPFTAQLSHLEAFAMAYDPVDGYVVLFGGVDLISANLTNETWTYRNGAWTLLRGAGGPVPREGAMMAWDAADGYLVLFGGSDETGSNLYPDTWSFVHGHWSPRSARPTNSTNTPTERAFGSMSYDPSAKKVVLFGGCTGFGCPQALGDTWTYGNGTWTNISSGLTAPAARVLAPMAWDPALGASILFGGLNASFSVLGDTWEFASGVWTNLTHPGALPPTDGAWMAWDPVPGYLALFNGAQTFSFYRGNWSLLSTPPPATNGSFAYESSAGTYDAADGYPLMVGSVGDTWLFAGTVLGTLLPLRPAIDANESVSFTTGAFGGVAPYTYRFSGLPVGCAPGNVSNFTCVFAPAGPETIAYNVSDATGNYSNRTLNLTVYPTLTARGSVVPSAIDLGSTANYTLNISGGSGGPSFNFTGLPYGCGTGDRNPIGCLPRVMGNFSSSANVTDLSGANVGVVNLNLTVWPALFANLSPNFVVIDLGETFHLNGSGHGGHGSLIPSWTGLPLSCAVGAVWSVDCRPLVNGTWRIGFHLTDQIPFTATPPITTAVVNALPTVSIVDDQPEGLAPFTDTFYETSALGTAPYAITWNFGDGSAPVTPGPGIIHHTFANTGNYTVRITGTDTRGFPFNGSINVSVVDPLLVRIHAVPRTEVLDQGQSLQLSAVVTGGGSPVHYAWSGLPTGCLAEDAPQIACTPTVWGDFKIGVSVSDPIREVAPDQISVAISPPLSAALSNPRSSSGCTVPFVENLSAQVRDGVGPYRYAWTFGDGTSGAVGPIELHSYTGAGRYPIGLTVTDTTNATVHVTGTAWVGPTGCPPEFLGIPLTTGGWGIIAGGIAAAALLGAYAVVRIRRGRSPRPPTQDPDTDPVDPSVPDPSPDDATQAGSGPAG